MNPPKDHPLTLHLLAQIDYLPVAVQFVETGARVFGLGKDAVLRLGLATEEIFSYLASNVCPGHILDIRCHNRIFSTRVEVRFAVSTLNMGALNMTASGSCAEEDDLTEMGLVIAARAVDRLRIVAEGGLVCLSFEKEKDYPPAPEVIFPRTEDMTGLMTATPNAEELMRFIHQVGQDRADPLQPAFFQYPGKVADMSAVGDLQALVAINGRGTIVGGALIVFRAERIVEIIGPYAFSQAYERKISGLLLDVCIGKVVRSKAIAVLSMTGLPVFLRPQFEALGATHYYRTTGETLERPAYYRLLHEDPGCQVWSHPVFTGYLRESYSRLFLAREIREVQDLGETKGGASIFAADAGKERSEAILRPLWPGKDADMNVKRHIACLRAESFQNIFFELDLGISWHASLIPVLLSNQFQPELILPFAGQADMAVFQYHATPRS